MKFFGSVEHLQEIVTECGVTGRWEFRENHRFYAFRARGGEVINWWPKTGTVVVQGRSNSAFRQCLLQKLMDQQMPLLATLPLRESSTSRRSEAAMSASG